MELSRWEHCVLGAAVASMLVAPQISGVSAYDPTLNILIVGTALTLLALPILVLRLNVSGWAALGVLTWAVVARWLLGLSATPTALVMLGTTLLVLVVGVTAQARPQIRWRARRRRVLF